MDFGLLMRSATVEELDKQVGARIRVHRRLIRISQQELANAIGMSWKQVHKYESGKARVPSSTIYQIAKALGVAPFTFFEMDAVESEESVFGEALQTEESKLLNEGFRRIRSGRTRRRIVALVESLADYRDASN